MSRDALLVQSLERGLRVLEAWGDERQHLSLAEVAARAGIDKSAAQRFTHTLERCGYLEKDDRTRRYALGKKVLERSYAYLRTNPLVEVATPALVELRRICGQHVKLSLFDDTTVIYAIRQQSDRETFAASIVGRRLPVQLTAGGRAMLAALPDATVVDILERANMIMLTPRTQRDRAIIQDDIRAIRATGYATLEEQCLLGEIVVAAAVLDADAKPVAAVHIAGSLGQWTRADFERQFAGLALEAANSLSRSAACPNAA